MLLLKIYPVKTESLLFMIFGYLLLHSFWVDSFLRDVEANLWGPECWPTQVCWWMEEVGLTSPLSFSYTWPGILPVPWCHEVANWNCDFGASDRVWSLGLF